MLSRRQFAGLALTTTAVALVATPTLAGSKADGQPVWPQRLQRRRNRQSEEGRW